ncbi:conserved hypothetical protein [Teredinibacter turnerae T7901]|uniref:Uncharacterized protein n=1 Tax=Teredinibacter turnerae (strain ATCC 39867 / T7901) TaxID=377629 RepID=C5BJE0_TERTT|nr:conserved hypothetical protein [Teredinibacter turnerae T7901]
MPEPVNTHLSIQHYQDSPTSIAPPVSNYARAMFYSDNPADSQFRLNPRPVYHKKKPAKWPVLLCA